MPNYNSINSFLPKELLNKNRVLTISNNRKCNYLIVDVGRESTTIMGVNNQNNTNDIIILKTLNGIAYNDLVNEVYWMCKEHDTQIVLSDCMGYGLGFIETFKMNMNQSNISIREISGREILNNDAINSLYNDLENGSLRFLQSPEIAEKYYNKSFFGLSNTMKYHKETDRLINEISNIKLQIFNGNIKINRFDSEIDKSGAMCLFLFYAYLGGLKSDSENDSKQYETTKRMSKYNVLYGTFYKYLFKCVENENIKVIFYHNGKHKLEQFKNIVQEEQVKKLFNDHIKRLIISKENLEINFFNGSQIKFVLAGDNARGYRYHYAVVDREIEEDVFYMTIAGKGILFDMAKREGKIKDRYNIDYIDM